MMEEKKRLGNFDGPNTVFRAMMLAISCVASFWLITNILASVYSISRDDDLLGGMWAVVATIFVFRNGYAESVGAALLRMSATFASCVLCFVYLLIFPFSFWGLSALTPIAPTPLALI